MKKFLGVLVLFLCGGVFSAYGQPGKISGYMFGDYYYMAASHKSNLKGQNGFRLRRIYFTYDKELGSRFDTRLRLEMNSAGHFTGKSKLVPSVKDAYLRWKKNGQQIILGISSTPTWDVIEKVWGYRSVEKTALDLQKIGSSRGFGLAVKGNLLADGTVKYHLMLANGTGTQPEANKEKKILGSIGFYPNRSIIIELYGDFERQPGSHDVYTLQAFAAYKTNRGRIGVQFAHQTRRAAGSPKLEVASIFGAVRLSGKVNFFARIDKMFEPNPNGAAIAYIPFDPGARSLFAVTGLDFIPAGNIHFMPNVELVSYEANASGQKPGRDLIPRVTFYYKF
ncbi:hypothetical protein BMS3Abin05_00803 [bacterium BMS3Abin05]|nr:hypothetical protein BMS3Abin05_00803 [bacterium BMS3Abin05]